MDILTKKQYEDIGRLAVVEMDRNRGFRRTLEALPLGASIIAVIERDETYKPKTYKPKTTRRAKIKAWRRKMLDKFREWNQQEI